MRDVKPVQPRLPPPVKGAVPLFNPSEIQLHKKDALLAEEKNSSRTQGGNPFRKTANGMDCYLNVYYIITQVILAF